MHTTFKETGDYKQRSSTRWREATQEATVGRAQFHSPGEIFMAMGLIYQRS